LSNEQDCRNNNLNFKVLSKQIYSIHKNLIQDFGVFFTVDLQHSSNNKRKANFIVECEDLLRKNACQKEFKNQSKDLIAVIPKVINQAEVKEKKILNSRISRAKKTKIM
jgi:hypothetical protein